MNVRSGLVSYKRQGTDARFERNDFVAMKLLERNADRTDPWALRWPDLKIGLRALLWPVWKRYNVLPLGCTDSRLSQV